jgi:hypothetical protein
MVWTRKALHQAIEGGEGGASGWGIGGGALSLDLKVRNYNPYRKYQVNAQIFRCAMSIMGRLTIILFNILEQQQQQQRTL